MSEGNQPPSYEETYAKLKQSYVERLKDNLADIVAIKNKLQSEPVGLDGLMKIRALAHGLAGSGTTFGFPEITNKGRKTEQYLDKVLKAMKPEDILGEDTVTELILLLAELGTVCDVSIVPDELIGDDITFADPKGDQAPLVGKSKLAVLVVDDDRNLTSLVSLKLTQREFGVMTANNGAEALASIKERRPDLIILDLNMPGASGHDVLRSLKQDPDTVSIPVLMLTASAKQQDVVGALHSGAIDYIVKPIDINDLVARVERLCQNLRRTVLIADNDQLILTLLNHKFRSKGLNVLLADNGNDAWDSIQKNKPDLVVLDIMMPGMDGFAVMNNMRQNPATSKIPVIVLSANKSEEDIGAAKKAGAVDYVVKPLLTDNLLTKCMQILRKPTV